MNLKKKTLVVSISKNVDDAKDLSRKWLGLIGIYHMGKMDWARIVKI